MIKNIFFKKKNINLKKIFPEKKNLRNFLVKDIKPLHLANKNEISFFDSIAYKEAAEKTKASVCITNKKIEKFLPKKTEKIIVNNVLYELAKAIKAVYPFSDLDLNDNSLTKPKKNFYKNVSFGNNVLIGKNVIIGKNSEIGSNSIIESNVKIGKNSIIGYGSIIRNTIIGENVVIQDNCKIGQKGFGFIPLNKKNYKFPHIGKVVIKDNVEIASGCTIDRGSVDDTIIGENTYIDNQVHIAHNVQIGSNCMIAGQVGFAGSSKLGNNVKIGGQAGISGHLKIGNNVKIGGGSGVVKDVNDNEIIMGYPAKPLKEFLKRNK